MARRLILDVDTGDDDAVVIMLAVLRPELDLVGCTTVWGNHDVETTTDNTLRVLDHIGGSDVGVFQGRSGPGAPRERPAVPAASASPDPPRHVAGRRGHARHLPLPAPSSVKRDAGAVEWMVETLRAATEPITVVAVAPLTNIAAVLAIDPGIVRAVDELVIMGGGHALGSVTPSAIHRLLRSVNHAHPLLRPAEMLPAVALTQRRNTGMRPLTLIADLLVGGFAPIAAIGGSDDDEEPTADLSSSGPNLELISDGTLTVGADIPSAPFEFGDPPDYEGFDIDLINAIGEDLGLEVEIVEEDFPVILAGQWEGRFDLSMTSASITDKHEKRIDFGDPYFETEQSLLVLKDGAIQSIDDITADTVVGAEAGTTGETYARENTDAEVRTFKSPGEISALVAGEVEAVFQDVLVTVQAVEDKDGLEVVETFPTGELYGMIFLKGSPVVDPVNESLQRLKDDGTLAEIYLKWFDREPPEELLKATREGPIVVSEGAAGRPSGCNRTDNH